MIVNNFHQLFANIFVSLHINHGWCSSCFHMFSCFTIYSFTMCFNHRFTTIWWSTYLPIGSMVKPHGFSPSPGGGRWWEGGQRSGGGGGWHQEGDAMFGASAWLRESRILTERKPTKKNIWLGGIKIHWQWVTPCYSPFLDADVGITGGFCWPGFPIQWTEMRSAEHGKDWADWAAGGLRQTFWLSLQRTSCPMGVA